MTQYFHLGLTIYFAWRQPILQSIFPPSIFGGPPTFYLFFIFFKPSTSKFKIWNHMFANKECCKKEKKKTNPYAQQKGG